MKLKRPIVNRLADLERLSEVLFNHALQSALRGGDQARAMRAARRWTTIAAEANAVAITPVRRFRVSGEA